jgi:manganese efflux pump family protein
VNLFEIALLTVALSFDLSGICFASGALLRKADATVSFRFLLILFAAQVMLSFAGLMVGTALYTLVGESGQWIAFILFGGTGLKILFDSFQPKPDAGAFETSEVKTTVVQALAESINTFIITTGIGFLSPDIPKALLVIGVLMLFLPAVWLYLGRIKDRSAIKFRLSTVGGLILLAAGLHLLIKLI